MASRRKLFGLLTLIVLLGVGLAVFSSGNLLAIGDAPPTVYLPNYAGGICMGTTEVPVLTYDMSDASLMTGNDHMREFYCNYNTPQCKVEYKLGSTIGFLKVYKCPQEVLFPQNSDECNIIEDIGRAEFAPQENVWHSLGTFNYNENIWSNDEKIVVVADDGLLGGNLESGDLQIRLSADEYNLISISDRNKLTSAVSTCDLDNLGRELTMTKEEINGLFSSGSITADKQVKFGRTFSYIASASRVESALQPNIIKYSGKWVYVDAPGGYCPLNEGEDGRIYADCGDSRKSASDIICLPNSPYCQSDGKGFIEAEEKECTWYSGVPTSRAPNKDGEYCMWRCDAGKLVDYDCQEIKDCPEGQKWSYDAGKCVKTGSALPPVPIVETLPQWVIPVLIMLGFLGLGIATYVIIGRKKK